MVKELRKMGTRLIASHKKRLSEKPTNAITILNDGSGNHQIKVVLYGKNYYQELVIIAEQVLTTSVIEFLRIQNMKLTPTIVFA